MRLTIYGWIGDAGIKGMTLPQSACVAGKQSRIRLRKATARQGATLSTFSGVPIAFWRERRGNNND
jgi:hypothetical protein